MIELEDNQRKLNSLTEKIKTIEAALKLSDLRIYPKMCENIEKFT